MPTMMQNIEEHYDQICKKNMTKYKKTAGADADDDARVKWQLQRVWMGNPAFGCGSQ